MIELRSTRGRSTRGRSTRGQRERGGLRERGERRGLGILPRDEGSLGVEAGARGGRGNEHGAWAERGGAGGDGAGREGAGAEAGRAGDTGADRAGGGIGDRGGAAAEAEAEAARAAILARLRAFAPGGTPLPASALPRELYSAVLARFGSIASARAAAGLAAAVPARRRWSEAAVVEELRRLHALGVRVRGRELREAGHSGVVEAAQIYCGGLDRARRLAQIADERRIARQREPWDAERVVSEIRALRGAGQSLARSRVDPRLYLAARRYFGGWGGAVEAAGEDYERVRLNAPSLPAAQLLAQLRALAAAQPEMSASELEGHHLGAMLRRRFASLSAAVRAAGLTAWPRRERRPLPTAEETLRRIRERGASGRSVARRDARREDRSLLRAAERHFGSWQRAIDAARAGGAAPLGAGAAGAPS